MMVKRRAKSKAAAAFLAVCCTLSPLAAFAAESAGDKQEFALPEIIVTATRTEQTVKDTPSTVQVITREDIERRQSQTLADALRQATGIIMFNDFQSRANLSIRGSESRHVLIMVDGRRLSGELSYNSANVYDINRIRMENVERIEIIRGSAGAIYGSDAMGGVINIITKKPKQNEGHLSYEYAVWDGREKANQNMQFYYQGSNDTGNFVWSLNAGQHKPQPFFDIEHGTITVMQGMPPKPVEQPYSLPYTVNYYGKETPLALSGTWTLNNGNYVRVDYSKLWEKTYKDTISTMGGLKSQRVKNDNTRTDWSLEYGSSDESRDWQIRAYQSAYDKDYSGYDDGTLARFDLVDRKISTLEGRKTWQANERNKFTAGFEWRYDESEGTRINKPGSTGTPVKYGPLNGVSDEASLEYRALYLQDEIKSGDKLLLIPSLRYDWSDMFSSEVTPRLGITYKAMDDMRIKAVIGKGYKTPTVNELYHDWEMFKGGGPKFGQYFEGNPNIQPEKSTDYEVSLEKDWDKSAARISVFRSNVKDLIKSDFTGIYMNHHDGTTSSTKPVGMVGGDWNEVMSYINIDKATIQGFETEYTHSLTDAVKLRMGYTYLDARDDTADTRLLDRARHQLSMGVSYQPPQSAWALNLNMVTLKDYITKVNPISTSELTRENQSYSIVNIMAQNNINAHTMLYLGVDNLTDHVDYSHGNVGRVYRTGVQYKF